MIRVSSITKTSIAITTIEKSRVSLSLTLGNMNNSGRVSDITSSTGISTSKGGDGSGSKSSSMIRVSSIASITKTSIAITTIEKSRVSLSFTLGNMDNSGGVSNITSSTGISTSKGGD